MNANRPANPATAAAGAAPATELALLRELERRPLWLATWTIHHANHLRPNRDGLEVGGLQSSCASIASVMTARRSGRRTGSP